MMKGKNHFRNGWLNRLEDFKLPFLNAIFIFLTITSFGQKNKKYSEDLSKYRQRVELVDPAKSVDTISQKSVTVADPKYTVNAKVDAVLDSIDRFNLTRRYVDGFTIQIYSGQRKDDAMNAKKRIQDELPYMNANLQYQQPKFKVTIGKYLTRLEAQKDLLTLRRRFSNAILVPERILIR
jgi:septal ring-binding cell division protein DamX